MRRLIVDMLEERTARVVETPNEYAASRWGHAVKGARKSTCIRFSEELSRKLIDFQNMCSKDQSLQDSVNAAFRLPADPLALQLDFPSGGNLLLCDTAQAEGHTFYACAQVTSDMRYRILRFDSTVAFWAPGYKFGEMHWPGEPQTTPDRATEDAVSMLIWRTMCACALLNGKVAGEPIVRESQSGRNRNGQPIKYMAVKTLRLVVPKERVISIASRWARRRAAGVRAHGVLGAWCERHSSGRRGCVHFWQTDPQNPNHMICICGRRRWWRAHHQRGDAGRGFVKKDYEAVSRGEIGSRLK